MTNLKRELNHYRLSRSPCVSSLPSTSDLVPRFLDKCLSNSKHQGGSLPHSQITCRFLADSDLKSVNNKFCSLSFYPLSQSCSSTAHFLLFSLTSLQLFFRAGVYYGGFLDVYWRIKFHKLDQRVVLLGHAEIGILHQGIQNIQMKHFFLCNRVLLKELLFPVLVSIPALEKSRFKV